MFDLLRSSSYFEPSSFRATPRLSLAKMDLFWAALASLLMLAVAAITPAHAGNTNLLTEKNAAITFPFSPPVKATGAAGSIDNMIIGASTPAAGTFSTLKSSDGLVCATYAPSGTPAATDVVFFVATRAYIVVSASEVHSVAAGGASALQLSKDTGTNAPGAGTDLLTAGFDLNGTANTTQVGSMVASAATRTLAAGDRLAVDYANAIQSSAGVVVTACMAPQ